MLGVAPDCVAALTNTRRDVASNITVDIALATQPTEEELRLALLNGTLLALLGAQDPATFGGAGLFSSVTYQPSSSPSAGSGSGVPVAIVAGAVGGAVLLVLIVAAVVYSRRRARRNPQVGVDAGLSYAKKKPTTRPSSQVEQMAQNPLRPFMARVGGMADGEVFAEEEL